MKPGTITIDKKRYTYAFKQKARRLFMEKHGLEYFADYEDKLKALQADPEKGMSVSGMGVFADLVGTAIQSENPDYEYDTDTMVDYFIANPEEMVAIGASFAKAQEQPEQKSSGGAGGKSKARAK